MIPRYRGVVTKFDDGLKKWMVRFPNLNHPFSNKEFAVDSVHEDIVLAEGVEVEFVLATYRGENDTPLVKAIDVKPVSPLLHSSDLSLSAEAVTELGNAERDSWLKSIAEEVSENFDDSGGGSSKHRYLQEFLRKAAEEKGWHPTLEKGIAGNRFVDLFLQKGGVAVGCEISVSTTPQHELGNIKKCLEAGCDWVVSVSLDSKCIEKVRKIAADNLPSDQARQVQFLLPEDVPAFLDKVGGDIVVDGGMVCGYKVKVVYARVSAEEAKQKREAIAAIMVPALRRLRKEVETKQAAQ